MANALLTPDSDQDEALNKGQQYYDDKFNDIVDAERNADSGDDVSEADKPAGWSSSYNGGSEKGGVKKVINKAFLKKASPIIGGGGIAALIGFMFLGLTAPSLLFVQMKETMVDRFNTQLSAFESRSTKLMRSKVEGGTKGFCGSKVTVRCKFTSLPEKHMKKLKAAGITFEGETTRLGRTTFTAYVIDGKTIPPQDFNKEVGSNKALRSALRKAYNPKFASFNGKGWSSISSRFKVGKQKPVFDAGADATKAQEKLNSIGKDGTPPSDTKVRAGCKGDECAPGDWTEENENQTKERTSELAESGKNGTAAKAVRSSLSKVGSSAGGVLKITGPVDSACLVYGAVNTLSFAAKTIRNAQLIRFAMVFLTTADAIKAGEAPDPKDIEFLGNNLTATIKDPSDPRKTLVGSATDSFGYKYAAYGDPSAPKKNLDISNRFMAGGGLVGELDGTVASVLSFIPNGRAGARSTCGTLANPFVQAGSLLAGIAVLFVPGVNAAKVVISATAEAAAAMAAAIIPELLADIVAGTVTENIVGEESGNAITSGSGAMMSALATSNGVGYMSKDQALAYNSELTETKNDYIAMERSEKSPLDPTSPYTFIGSITSNLLPIIHSADNNPVTVVASILTSSVAGIIPKASAASNEQFGKVLSACSDLDLQEAGIATDPFCNTINGIPSKYTSKDPIQIIDELGDQLSDSGKPQGAYKEFVDKCIESSNPVGYYDDGSGMNFHPDRAKECIINDSNANYYVNYLDMRIEEGMEDKDKTKKASSGEWVHPLGEQIAWGTYVGRSHSKGALDFGASEGAPVLAVSNGTVIASGLDSSYGNFVTIQHDDGTVTHYAHFVTTPMVNTGDVVSAGQQIGQVGNTGDSDGAHLHLEGRSSPSWDDIVPGYPYLLERGVDIGPCSVTPWWNGPCSLSGYPG